MCFLLRVSLAGHAERRRSKLDRAAFRIGAHESKRSRFEPARHCFAASALGAILPRVAEGFEGIGGKRSAVFVRVHASTVPEAMRSGRLIPREISRDGRKRLRCNALRQLYGDRVPDEPGGYLALAGENHVRIPPSHDARQLVRVQDPHAVAVD